MRRLILYAILFLFLQPSCSPKTSNNTVTVVKPKYHHRLFSKKKDKRVKRTRLVKVRN